MPNIDACYRSIAADPSAQHEGQLSASNCRSGSHISWSLLAGSSPSLPDGSNPSAAIVQSASDVQCSRLLKTTSENDSAATYSSATTLHNPYPIFKVQLY
ncbi:hypothetical protein CEJ45_23675 [Herbaspirillum aquaticum]|uniref:Uncharacterized protein n=1 Tax=Herbaspirillum aquaticum TaxID=568783 RepID=A0A225SRM8_9BURK|nr:hypothetical protein CEJ45_23675 [Herbaspirillum aquaticum]